MRNKLLVIERQVDYMDKIAQMKEKIAGAKMTAANPRATYICLNYGQAVAPAEIQRQSICIDGNIGEIL